MPALIDGRPAGLDALFRPGNTFPVTFTWPAGTLAGRTFTATLDAAALGLAVVGDVMTVTASEAQTAAAAPSGQFTLTETTGGTTQDLIAGRWVASDGLAAAPSLDVTVTRDGGSVVVSFPAVPQAVGGGFLVGGDVTITGEILTGTFGTPATFGGIEREGRVFPAGEMVSPTGVINFGDGFPRVHCPNGVTTDVYMIFEVEEWWLDSTIGVYFEWVNDHTTTGDVRFDCSIKECDIATETLAAAGTIATRTFTAVAPAANTSTTAIVASVLNGNQVTFDPGTFASFYSLRISRLGADAADTLAGPIGLVAASMTRGQ